MWSMTWTAVVGSFTAADSALLAMSTSTRRAKAGSWSKVRSSPSATVSSSSGRARLGVSTAVDLDEHAAAVDEVADRVRYDQFRPVGPSPADQAVGVDGLDGTAVPRRGRPGSAPSPSGELVDGSTSQRISARSAVCSAWLEGSSGPLLRRPRRPHTGRRRRMHRSK